MNVARLQAIIDELLVATGASRTTLRVDLPDDFFPVVAEACSAGIRPIRGDRSVDLRSAPTFTRLQETLGVILQEDCARSEPPTPPAVMDLYGVRAQMLAAVARGRQLLGTVSVHDAIGPRTWSVADREALDRAVSAILVELAEFAPRGAL